MTFCTETEPRLSDEDFALDSFFCVKSRFSRS